MKEILIIGIIGALLCSCLNFSEQRFNELPRSSLDSAMNVEDYLFIEKLSDSSKVKTLISQSTYAALSISIPQNSGLTFVDYEVFTIENDTLFEINSSFAGDLGESSEESSLGYINDTIGRYALPKTFLLKLRLLIELEDSLGYHSAYGCNDLMGKTRFYISASLGDKKLEGFVANCYRKHIFDFVDIINESYPEGNALRYDKMELLTTEKECNEYEFGRND